MTPTPRSQTTERGSVLIMTLVVLMVLMALSATFLAGTLQQQAGVRATIEAERVLQTAEAAADLALLELRLGQDLATDGVGNASGAISGCDFVVSVAPPLPAPPPYTISATATSGRIIRTVELVVGLSGGGFPFSIFGDEGVEFSSDSLTDSYDSDAGAYAAQVGAGGFAAENGHVASNGPIGTGNGIIHGDATPGTGFLVEDPVLVTGSTAPATEPFTFDPYVYDPPGTPTGIYIGANGDVISGGTHHFTEFKVGGGDTVTINGETTIYVDGKFTLSGGSVLLLTEGASLVIHHGTFNFTISGGSIVNEGKKPQDLQIWSATTNDAVVSGGAAFFGVLHALTAEVRITGGSDYFGAVAGKSITISGGSSIHYDEALANSGGASSGELRVQHTRRGGSSTSYP